MRLSEKLTPTKASYLVWVEAKLMFYSATSESWQSEHIPKAPDVWEQRQKVKVQKMEGGSHLKHKLYQLCIIVQGPACNNCLEFKDSQLLSASVISTIGGSCCFWVIILFHLYMIKYNFLLQNLCLDELKMYFQAFKGVKEEIRSIHKCKHGL